VILPRRLSLRLTTLFVLALSAISTGSLAGAVSTGQRPIFDHASTTQKLVALTFDADMTPGMLRELKSGRIASWYNEKVIAALREQQVPATLFLTGLWIEAYGATTKELSENPLFELANHSYSHGAFHSPCYNLFPIGEANQVSEVQKTDDLLKRYAASYKKYFRFPGLCSDPAAVKKVEDQGYTVIGGDVEGADAFVKSAKWVVSDVVANVHPGSIVVLHMHGGPNASQTAVALPDIIKKLRADGYTFVKVSDLLQLPPGEPVRPVVTSRRAPSPAAGSSTAVTPDYFPLLHFFRR
jgi:peptidoglycan-N-acetylglucosamine deacetylase